MHFMEPEGSLLCLQQPAYCITSQMTLVDTLPTYSNKRGGSGVAEKLQMKNWEKHKFHTFWKDLTQKLQQNEHT